MKRGLALIAALRRSRSLAVAAAGARSNDTTITGAGSTFVAPLVSAWTPALGNGVRLQRSSTARSAPAQASRRSRTDQVDFGASDAPLTPDQATACKGCVQIPWALSATSIAYNVPGAPGAHATSTGDDREDLPRQDHELERSGDRRAEPGREPPEPEDHAGLPLGRLRHVVQLHRLPLGRQRQWKTKIGVSTQPAFPAGIGAKGSAGVAGVVSRTDGAVTLRRRRLRDQEPHPVRSDAERRREVPLPEPPADQRPRLRRSRRCRRTTRCTS